MKYGYARVSSVGQDLTIQVQKLNEVGCDVIREEKVSGTSLKGRKEFETLMEFMREGD
jgi:DNA invertase Pin-like site-specific DNA recombinase